MRKLQVFAAAYEEAQQGWVWLCDKDLPPRSVVKIRCNKTHKSVYCEALQMESNFLSFYNQNRRIHITDTEHSIVINGWYRTKLGILKTQEDIDFDITAENNLCGRMKVCFDHPQVIVRMAAKLSLWSLVLAIVAVFPELIRLFNAFMQCHIWH